MNLSEYTNNYFEKLNQILHLVDKDSIEVFVKLLDEARRKDLNIFFIGNGGSAATASHFANDLSFGSGQDIKSFRAISLVDNVAINTALSNDYGFETSFAKQISVYGKEKDILVSISASGNSKNLISAIKLAKNLGMVSISITAFDGGEVKRLSDFNIHFPTEIGDYGRAEDAHMILDHLVSNYFRDRKNID